MKRYWEKLTLALAFIVFLNLNDISACTSAVVGAKASAHGRPMLWKHRDTSNIDNKVEYVAPENGSYGYVALFNADDLKLEQAWTGMNDVGFAIMNTASYNIKDDNVPAKKMDREGYLMTIALKSCRTVDDFEKLLNTLPRPMGVEANFGVIDAEGGAAYFETNNHSFVRFNVSDSPEDILIRSNYSHSGRPNEGYGFIREANAEHLLLSKARESAVSPEYLTEDVSRSFYHDLYKRDFSSDSCMVVDQDFIPRYKSCATIVIEGCVPVKDAAELMPGALSKEYIMWTGLGYPPCSEIVPVWCSPSGVDNSLRGLLPGGHSEMSDRVKARRNEVFPIKKGSGDRYIDMNRLFNKEGIGYVQILTKQNRELYSKFKR